MLDAYNTVAKAVEREIVIQKSRFIGQCYPMVQQGEAEAKLTELRKRYWDASHNCYAYVIGRKGEAARFSDDGEPGGTAGRPMMEVLRARQIVDVLVVVTRYFGGVLLGAGGLVRAYSRAASEALQAAEVICMSPTCHYRLTMSYPQWSRLQHALQSAYYRVESVEYGAQVNVQLAVKESDAPAFIQDILQRSDGQLRPVSLCEDYSHWPILNET